MKNILIFTWHGGDINVSAAKSGCEFGLVATIESPKSEPTLTTNHLSFRACRFIMDALPQVLKALETDEGRKLGISMYQED